jgi:hypothetical protein
MGVNGRRHGLKRGQCVSLLNSPRILIVLDFGRFLGLGDHGMYNCSLIMSCHMTLFFLACKLAKRVTVIFAGRNSSIALSFKIHVKPKPSNTGAGSLGAESLAWADAVPHQDTVCVLVPLHIFPNLYDLVQRPLDIQK